MEIKKENAKRYHTDTVRQFMTIKLKLYWKKLLLAHKWVI